MGAARQAPAGTLSTHAGVAAPGGHARRNRSEARPPRKDSAAHAAPDHSGAGAMSEIPDAPLRPGPTASAAANASLGRWGVAAAIKDLWRGGQPPDARA